MTDKILVAHASKYGSTAEIAERIASVLEGAGMDVVVQPVDKVRDIAPYSAVVLGIAVYMGQWRKEAVKFLEANANALAAKDTWLFVSGPTEEGDPVELMQGWVVPNKLQPLVDQANPHEVTVFHGALDVDNLNFMERTVIKTVKAETGDFRDWEAIEAWAQGVAASLVSEHA